MTTERLANELLGFRAEIPFEAGMQELLEWLEGQELPGVAALAVKGE